MNKIDEISEILASVSRFSQTGQLPEMDMDSAPEILREGAGNIPAQTLRNELERLIMGENCVSAMLGYRDIVAAVIPEMEACFDFEQHSRYHKYTVYEHIVRAVGAAPEDVFLRRVMLLHDIGKPQMFVLDENGEGHFKGHAGVSAQMAEKILKRLGYGAETVSRTCLLIAHHSDKINSDEKLAELVKLLGRDGFLQLIEIKKADNRAKRGFVLSENEEFDGYARRAAELFGREGAEEC